MTLIETKAALHRAGNTHPLDNASYKLYLPWKNRFVVGYMDSTLPNQ